MESNVADDTDVPMIFPEPAEGAGEDSTADRVEQLRHMGLRPKDAERVAELEDTLDLPEQQNELDRARAAAVLRADPEARGKVIHNIMVQLYEEQIGAYEALCRLQQLEIEGEEYGFARVMEKMGRFELVLYDDGRAKKAYRYNPRKEVVRLQDVSISAWYADLPE